MRSLIIKSQQNQPSSSHLGPQTHTSYDSPKAAFPSPSLVLLLRSVSLTGRANGHSSKIHCKPLKVNLSRVALHHKEPSGPCFFSNILDPSIREKDLAQQRERSGIVPQRFGHIQKNSSFLTW